MQDGRHAAIQCRYVDATPSEDVVGAEDLDHEGRQGGLVGDRDQEPLVGLGTLRVVDDPSLECRRPTGQTNELVVGADGVPGLQIFDANSLDM